MSLEMRQLFTLLLLLLHTVNCVDPPPSIYEWIEENAHICTSIPADGHNVKEENVHCVLKRCQIKVPTSACAVEVSPNEVDVEIGCHPVPELCILELRNRYEEFFGGLKTTGTNPSQTTSPQEEDIFVVKSNPFDHNVIASLGRSSNNNPSPSPQQSSFTSSIPHSSVFLATNTPVPLTQVTTNFPTSTVPSRHNPVNNPLANNQVITPTPQTETSTDLIQIDADSGDSTTVRANVFSSPNGENSPIHIAGRLDEIAKHGRVSIPMHSSTRSPLIGPTRSLNKEVMPNEQAKLNPSKSLFEKRTETLAPLHSQTTNRPSTNNSWALFRSSAISTTTLLPFEKTTKRSLQETQFNQSTKLLSNDEKKECKDNHELCCFWAIAGECDTSQMKIEDKKRVNFFLFFFFFDRRSDSNPFWMRVKCSKTCGTCGCSLRAADTCVSTGINCTIPTTTQSTTTQSTTPRPTTTSTTMSTTTETTRLTPPPKFNRFTIKPRNLPPWKKQPLENNAGPPAFRPENDGDGSSISNQVETSEVPTSTFSVPSGGYAEGDSVKATSFVRRPGIKSPATTASVENSLETESTEVFTTSAFSTSPLITTTTPANCFNYNRLCGFWADLGECIRNPFWMRPHCQLACQSCGESLNDVFAPKAKPNCSNQHLLCPFWAFIGECARNPRWMLKACAPSCRVC
ncbi:ShKT domain-containing protein [Aphelenchoides bicaudatus]|nr:ShKT domain-containing protein [Aphelenchoides bicaudatus]